MRVAARRRLAALVLVGSTLVLDTPVAQAADPPAGGPVVPSVAIGDASTREGGTGNRIPLRLTVVLDQPTDHDVVVSFHTEDGTATAGSDYRTVTGTATIPADQTGGFVDVTVLGDGANESNETFDVVLADPIGATIADGRGTGSIIDRDPIDFAGVSIGDATVAEGDVGRAALWFVMSLPEQSSRDVFVEYVTVDGTATSHDDFVPKNGMATIVHRTASVAISIPISADTLDEGVETFRVRITEVFGSTPGDVIGVATIRDDD